MFIEKIKIHFGEINKASLIDSELKINKNSMDN